VNAFAPEVWLNRGNVLQETDRLPEAIASYNEALRVRPNYPEALSGLGVALKESGEIDKALVCFNEALAHKPAYPDARNNRAGALLLKGMLRQGFEDFESRWERSNAPPKTVVAKATKWSGEDLKGRRILVWDEQGLGDLIQFSRFLSPLAAAGAEVTLLCRKNMQRLLGALPAPVRLVEALEPGDSFDFESALLSLPRGLGTTLETIPAGAPYLHPEPAAAAKWATRIGADGFRIGVCWHGNASINLKRSVPLSSFGAVAAIEGVRLISLVKDQSQIDIATPKGRFSIESLGEAFDSGPDSFIDCAAAMAALDLVITSDTAIAHLAGGPRAACFRRPETGARLALAARARRLALVSDDAAVSSAKPGRMGSRFRRDRGRGRSPRSGAAPNPPCRGWARRAAPDGPRPGRCGRADRHSRRDRRTHRQDHHSGDQGEPGRRCLETPQYSLRIGASAKVEGRGGLGGLEARSDGG